MLLLDGSFYFDAPEQPGRARIAEKHRIRFDTETLAMRGNAGIGLGIEYWPRFCLFFFVRGFVRKVSRAFQFTLSGR